MSENLPAVPTATIRPHLDQTINATNHSISSVRRQSALLEGGMQNVEPSPKRLKTDGVDTQQQINGSGNHFTQQLSSHVKNPIVSKSSPSPDTNQNKSNDLATTHESHEATTKTQELSGNLDSAPSASNPNAPSAAAAPPAAVASSVALSLDRLPLKSIKMIHLKMKYTFELEYMLTEFRKLECQLLGARGSQAQKEESAGSKERREKLHSFILHLEDTLRQIEVGCEQEAQGLKVGNPEQRGEAGEEKKSAQEEDEETVQKLEEHILANLLPVKVRLKKQLAAQKGATKNPAGMPASRRGMIQQSDIERGKGTFAAAAEQRRKNAEVSMIAAKQTGELANKNHTQFGKPLSGGGSSLTQKLHGQSLGSNVRKHGHGVGSSAQHPGQEIARNQNVLYAGVALGSPQVISGVKVASKVHKMVINSPASLLAAHAQSKANDDSTLQSVGGTAISVHQPVQEITPMSRALAPTSTQTTGEAMIRVENQISSGAIPLQNVSEKPPNLNPLPAKKMWDKRYDDPSLTEEERKKLRKKRKKKILRRKARRREMERSRQLVLHQQAIQSVQMPMKGPGGRKRNTMMVKINGKKRGPRTVEYICALCSEAYSYTSDCNPWWALQQHECPKCRKTQIPRVDISAPANAIVYHPALLAHADENSANSGGRGHVSNNVSIMQVSPSTVNPALTCHLSSTHHKYGSDSESEGSGMSDGSLSDCSSGSDDSDADALLSMTDAEHAENERFGAEYKGPTLPDYDAARLLILMAHASTCPGRHKSASHRDVCRSTKFLMLHIRDCPGTTSTFDVCPFPWCRKVKHLLYHLVSCTNPNQCSICSPSIISSNLSKLVGLNNHRLQKCRQRVLAAMKPSGMNGPQVCTTNSKANHPGHYLINKGNHTVNSMQGAAKSVSTQLIQRKKIPHPIPSILSHSRSAHHQFKQSSEAVTSATKVVHQNVAPRQPITKPKPIAQLVYSSAATLMGEATVSQSHFTNTNNSVLQKTVIDSKKSSTLNISRIVTPSEGANSAKMPPLTNLSSSYCSAVSTANSVGTSAVTSVPTTATTKSLLSVEPENIAVNVNERLAIGTTLVSSTPTGQDTCILPRTLNTITTGLAQNSSPAVDASAAQTTVTGVSIKQETDASKTHYFVLPSIPASSTPTAQTELISNAGNIIQGKAQSIINTTPATNGNSVVLSNISTISGQPNSVNTINQGVLVPAKNEKQINIKRFPVNNLATKKFSDPLQPFQSLSILGSAQNDSAAMEKIKSTIVPVDDKFASKEEDTSKTGNLIDNNITSQGQVVANGTVVLCNLNGPVATVHIPPSNILFPITATIGNQSSIVESTVCTKIEQKASTMNHNNRNPSEAISSVCGTNSKTNEPSITPALSPKISTKTSEIALKTSSQHNINNSSHRQDLPAIPELEENIVTSETKLSALPISDQA